jgi:DNA-binding LytR/AlgR family response regulator
MEKKVVYFNSRDELLRLDISKIVYFEGDGNYTNIVTVNKLKAVVHLNLSQMVDHLARQLGPDATIFMRIGKRFIINMHYVYQLNVLKQRLIMTDYCSFAFQISLSKDALRKAKDLILAEKL